jgi:hypothetical protein
MVAIAVVVDGAGGGIELMVPMAASSAVAAVDGGGNDGVFTDASHDNDRHPRPHHPCLPRTRIGLQGGGHAVTHLIPRHHGRHRWCHLCLHSRDDGTKEGGPGDRRGCNADIRGRNEVGHHDPTGTEVTQGQPVQCDNQLAC